MKEKLRVVLRIRKRFKDSLEFNLEEMVIPSVVNPMVFTENRPWGHFERYSLNEPCTVKLVYVEANRRLSLQYHNKRDEFWKVINGPAEVRTEDNTRVLQEGDTIMIPRKTVHRLGGLDRPAIILEISYGDFEESDIVRLQDDYSRQLDNAAPVAH
ncbi:MAG: phosphomannose isomerase type II C-terminal cupin domain [Nitrososphaera sp.]